MKTEKLTERQVIDAICHAMGRDAHAWLRAELVRLGTAAYEATFPMLDIRQIIPIDYAPADGAAVVAADYSFTLSELIDAFDHRFELDSYLAIAAREAIERKLDYVAALGVPRAGSFGSKDNRQPGLACLPDVTVVPAWSRGISEASLDDLVHVDAALRNRSNDEKAEALILLSPMQFETFSRMLFAMVGQSVIQEFQAIRPRTTVRSWAGGMRLGRESIPDGRIVAFHRFVRDHQNGVPADKPLYSVRFLLPQDFTQHPVELVGGAKSPSGIVVPCRAQTSGVVCDRDRIIYVDGL